MTVKYMQAITDRYLRLGYAPYRWFKADTPPPWQPLAKPLTQLRLGLLSTAGAYVVGQAAYHYKDDASIRAIDNTTPAEKLRFSHITENYLVAARRDPNCIFPLENLRKLVARGVLGTLADKVFSCMGGVYSQRRVREETAPALLAAFRAAQCDAALLVAM
jgi:D-proline reductase (dithiol) PrdB